MEVYIRLHQNQMLYLITSLIYITKSRVCHRFTMNTHQNLLLYLHLHDCLCFMTNSQYVYISYYLVLRFNGREIPHQTQALGEN